MDLGTEADLGGYEDHEREGVKWFSWRGDLTAFIVLPNIIILYCLIPQRLALVYLDPISSPFPLSVGGIP